MVHNDVFHSTYPPGRTTRQGSGTPSPLSLTPATSVCSDRHWTTCGETVHTSGLVQWRESRSQRSSLTVGEVSMTFVVYFECPSPDVIGHPWVPIREGRVVILSSRVTQINGRKHCCYVSLGRVPRTRPRPKVRGPDPSFGSWFPSRRVTEETRAVTTETAGKEVFAYNFTRNC